MTGRSPARHRTPRPQRRNGPHRAAPRVHITVLGGFDLRIDHEPVAVPAGSQHVLAFVALRCRAAVPRTLIAGTLWPEAPERCACANLRSALARLHHGGRQALEIHPAEVRLADSAAVDLHRARRIARGILDHPAPGSGPEPDLAVIDALSTELLPGWYDDWALLEAEDWRQLRLHALEALARRLIAERRYAAAVAAAQAAVHADPLRESAQACLIRTHLAEGNPCEALGAFARYARRLRRDVGLEPTPDLRRLVVGLAPASPRSRSGDGR
jgi:SARP family transcriptional regulator, regulator of embCAB operon